ncbi:transporter substrate-binding domain-containing protein [Pseudoalteromonas sp. MEBiC 03485]|uniref:substrate-binding periplasmic protein n=1 Tax=Pseudoalteromonas sp. MEBiC 03485 TaxID=2571103 RepID=UPI00102266C3|nr:transporter substrate-binding domain-containing protein [Pseudoalteromonas sp. MEBiC 03485]RZD22831.1 transporter substrate-binding domain-containing protein [Pseudoalteromonas sp. MEBiC 03485]
MQKVVFTLTLLFLKNICSANVKTINAKKAVAIPPETLRVIYPKTLPNLDEKLLYPLILLRTALERSGYNFTLTPSPRLLGQNRVLREIATGTGINVYWSMTNTEREKMLLPLRIPIFKGLFGWRLMFTTKRQLPYLSQIKTYDDLKNIIFIQGQHWPDTDILKGNNLTVATSQDFESLFVMLDKGRGQLFPRSILEIEEEKANFEKKIDLVVLPQLMLKYKSPIYFFFNKDKPEIAKAVNEGLKVMRKNGEFDELFFKYNRDFIKNAHVHDKIIIELNNNELPRLTPVEDKSLWLSIDKVP